MDSRRIYTLAYFGLIDERINWPDQDTPLIESNNPMKKKYSSLCSSNVPILIHKIIRTSKEAAKSPE